MKRKQVRPHPLWWLICISLDLSHLHDTQEQEELAALLTKVKAAYDVCYALHIVHRSPENYLYEKFFNRVYPLNILKQATCHVNLCVFVCVCVCAVALFAVSMAHVWQPTNNSMEISWNTWLPLGASKETRKD